MGGGQRAVFSCWLEKAVNSFGSADLKNKSYFTRKKIGLFGKSRESQFGTNKPQEENRLVQQRRGTIVYGEDGRGCFKTKTHWRKTRGRSDHSFSLAELLTYWISPGRYKVHPLLVGLSLPILPVIIDGQQYGMGVPPPGLLTAC